MCHCPFTIPTVNSLCDLFFCMLDNYIFYTSVSSVSCYSDCPVIEIVYFPTAVNAILNIHWPQPAKNTTVLLPVGKFCCKLFLLKV